MKGWTKCLRFTGTWRPGTKGNEEDDDLKNLISTTARGRTAVPFGRALSWSSWITQKKISRDLIFFSHIYI